MKKIWIVVCLILMGSVTLAQSGVSGVVVETPVSGLLVFSGSTYPDPLIDAPELILVDTSEGSYEVILRTDRGALSPIFDRSGEKIVYSGDNGLVEYFVASQTQFQVNDVLRYYPEDFSPDGQSILAVERLLPPNPRASTLGIMEVASSTFQPLFSFVDDQPITSLPSAVTPPDSSILYSQLRVARWNPRFPEWILLQIGTGSALGVGEEFMTSPITFLYNLQTSAALSLDALLPVEVLIESINWNTDGSMLHISTLGAEPGGALALVSFDPGNTTAPLHIVHQANTNFYVPLDWLGAGNLMLMLQPSSTGQTELVVVIAEIVDGQFYHTDFLRLSDSVFPRVRDIDWHITASDEEKRSLTCLFDQTLPAQLDINLVGRVTLSGTASWLRDDHSTQASIITQMMPGTPFMVIGLPYCEDGYRWWQVQLSNGTIGWTVEASTSEYFLEPFVPSTPLPTEIPIFMPTSTYSLTSTFTPTYTPTLTNTPTPTDTPTPTSTFTSTFTATPTATATASVTCTVTAANPSALVSAINTANGNGASADTICLSPVTYTFTSASNSIALPSVTTPITIVGNGAILERGGGAQFRAFNVTASGSLTLQNLTIRSFNAGGGNGGALQNAGSLTLDGVTLSGNTARFGGAVHSSGTLNIVSSTLSGNTAQENAGAVYLNSGTLTVTDSTFQSNSSRYGSGVYVNNGSAALTNVTVRSNTANEQGAGVYLRAGTLSITGGLFETNTARFGNGVYVDAGTATVSGATFQNNTATEEGAAIASRTGTVSVTSSTFINNRARFGGAVASAGTLTLSGSTFTNNTAVESGGAVYNTSGATANRVQNTCFSGNTARFGGAVFSTTGNFNARENWWGAASGPTSVMVNANVQTTPFLTACPN